MTRSLSGGVRDVAEGGYSMAPGLADRLVLPDSPATFVDIARWRGETQPDRLGYTFLLDGESNQVTLSFGELHRRARGVAALLQSNVAPGDRVLLLYPPGLDYIAAVFGCLYAGVVAVPAYPPRLNRSLERLEAIARDAQASVGLTNASTRPSVERTFSRSASLVKLPWLDTDALSDDLPGAWIEPSLASNSTALLQYTSGSTDSPRGVMLSHENLIRNHLLIRDFFGVTPESRGVFWLPPYHDMGLIGGILQACYFGTYTVLMSPLAFLQRPIRWLQAISRTRTTISGGPNFAYDLCARSVTAEQLAALDLSSWEVAFIGAEPVRPDVLTRFAEVFGPSGFRREALCPCYGLAEATLIVTGGRRHEPPVVRSFDQVALQAGIVNDTSQQETARRLVGCGHAPESQDVRIVDPATCIPSPPNRVGEIWVRGASVAGGYWNQPSATQSTFGGHLAATAEGCFLRTGDLGFLSDGELFVTGRMKDLIIIRGRNLYPQDIEATAEASHSALRANSGAAFAVDRDGEELLVIVQEIERTQRNTDLGQVCETIRQAVADEYEVGVHAVVLVKPGSIPKTSSGKIQRYRCRQEFLEGGLQVLELSVIGPDASLRSARPYIAPRSELERKLVRLWQDTLGIERIGIEDNFFALGGDSLLALQVIGRAREAGMELTIERLLERPTIAGLAVDMRVPAVIDAEQGPVTGPVPLTPRQHLYFTSGARHQRGERALLDVLRPLDPDLLRTAVESLLEHHDALRMRFTCAPDGWRAHIVACEEGEVFSHRDLSGLSDEEQRSTVEQVMKVARKEIDIAKGPLMRVVLFNRGHDSRQLLLFAIHHLVADGLSVAVLGEDLQLAYEQLRRGDQVHLPAKTTSVRTWAERLVAYANSVEARRELEYWLAAIPAFIPSLPVDYPDGVDGEGRMRRALVTFDPFETAALNDVAMGTFGMQIDKVVLGAVASAFARWTGQPFLHFEYTGHGREPLFHDVDLSRTVGWFTSRFPVFVPVEPTAGVGELAEVVTRQLREVPHGGVGFGILRYLSEDQAVVEAVRRLPPAEVGFHCQGQLDRLYAQSSLFEPGQRLPESTSNRLLPGTTWIQIMSNISHEQLHVRFEYHESVYASDTVQSLAKDTRETLCTLIAPRVLSPAVTEGS